MSEAGTSPDNIRSQIVLVKKGLKFVGLYNNYIYQNGVWQDSVIIEKTID